MGNRAHAPPARFMRDGMLTRDRINRMLYQAAGGQDSWAILWPEGRKELRYRMGYDYQEFTLAGVFNDLREMNMPVYGVHYFLYRKMVDLNAEWQAGRYILTSSWYSYTGRSGQTDGTSSYICENDGTNKWTEWEGG